MRRTLFLIAAGCIALLGFGIYLQEMAGLVPCPMCIVQRYALIGVALSAILFGLSRKSTVNKTGFVMVLLMSLFGAFVAARQSWLQWYPPEIATCGRDFYGMIESFPLQRVVPMIFKGSGDCIKVDWTFLGGSIANWSFICFSLLVVTSLIMLVRRFR